MWLLTILFVSHVRGIVAEFLNNLRETKLKIYKAVFVSAVISSELFKHKGTEPGGGGGGGVLTLPLFLSESRVLIVPAILRHLHYHISHRDDLLEKSLDACGNILTLLHNHDPVRGHKYTERVCMCVL